MENLILLGMWFACIRCDRLSRVHNDQREVNARKTIKRFDAIERIKFMI